MHGGFTLALALLSRLLNRARSRQHQGESHDHSEDVQGHWHAGRIRLSEVHGCRAQSSGAGSAIKKIEMLTPGGMRLGARVA
jgi:hypothetical protein